MEKELIERVDLCNIDGLLNNNAVGWSKNPVMNCNITRGYLRKKYWNYWTICNKKYCLTLAITNFDYAATGFIYMLDIEKNILIQDKVILPFGKNSKLSNNVDDTAFLNHKKMTLTFKTTHNYTTLKGSSEKFKNISLLVTYPENYESLNVTIPWNNKKFHFTSKRNCLPCEGVIETGSERICFDKSDTLATLDFGRGIWQRNIFWNWASFSSYDKSGNKIGINLGGTWTDNTGINENAVYINDKVYKINTDMIFKYDKSDRSKTWHIETKNKDSIILNFTPKYIREDKTNAAGVIRSNLIQIFGLFNGSITIDNKKYEIDNIFGCTEDHTACW